MKPVFNHLTLSIISIFILNSSHAQTSVPFNVSNQKAHTDLMIASSEPAFHVEFAADHASATKVQVWVNNTDKRRCSIMISNNEGVLWSKVFWDTNFTGIYDLSYLEDGKYTIRVSNGKEAMEKTIELSSKVYSVREINML